MQLIGNFLNYKHKVCSIFCMANDYSIRFTLNNGTEVTVKEVTDTKYDFELLMVNGTRKTFLWTKDTPASFDNRKGKADAVATEAVNKFISVHCS